MLEPARRGVNHPLRQNPDWHRRIAATGQVHILRGGHELHRWSDKVSRGLLVMRRSRWCKEESSCCFTCGLVEQGKGVIWGGIVVDGMVKLGERALEGILQRIEVLLAVLSVQNCPSKFITIPTVAQISSVAFPSGSAVHEEENDDGEVIPEQEPMAKLHGMTRAAPDLRAMVRLVMKVGGRHDVVQHLRLPFPAPRIVGGRRSRKRGRYRQTPITTEALQGLRRVVSLPREKSADVVLEVPLLLRPHRELVVEVEE